MAEIEEGGRQGSAERRRRFSRLPGALCCSSEGFALGSPTPSPIWGHSWLTGGFVLRTNFKCRGQRRPRFLSRVSLTASGTVSCVRACMGGGLTHGIPGSMFTPLDVCLAVIVAEWDACKLPGWGPHPRLVLLQGGGARWEKVAPGAVWAMPQSPAVLVESLCPSTHPWSSPHSGRERHWCEGDLSLGSVHMHASHLHDSHLSSGRLKVLLAAHMVGCR